MTNSSGTNPVPELWQAKNDVYSHGYRQRAATQQQMYHQMT